MLFALSLQYRLLPEQIRLQALENFVRSQIS